VNGSRHRRLRIEHAFCDRDVDAERQARLGVIAAVQPPFCCSDVGSSFDPPKQLGSEARKTGFFGGQGGSEIDRLGFSFDSVFIFSRI
jgi:predicted amidohydrolase YtcJ